MRPQDRTLINVLGTLFWLLVFSAIRFPYWIVWFIAGVVCGLVLVPVTLWLGFKDKTSPKMWRMTLLALAVGFIIGTSIVLWRALMQIEKFGWFADPR